ncbi:MAG: nitroreductase family protein [Clostridium sp.]
MKEVLEVIKSRRSIRAYLPEQIKHEEVMSVLEAGVYAPSSKNTQPWHFTVVQNSELINEMNEEIKKNMANSPIDFYKNLGLNPHYHAFYGAPTTIIISGEDSAPAPVVDSCAAIQNMLIQAESINLGSCWMGNLKFLFVGEKAEYFRDKLNIKDGYTPSYDIILGYKKMDPAAPPRRENTISFIK